MDPPFTIRAEHPGDADAIDAVVDAAFGDEGLDVVRLVAAIRASEHYEAELELVAEDGTGILGHVMLSWVGLESPARDRVLILSPMSVRPDRQRQGIGGALIVAVLDRAEQRGEPVVMVEGIPAYYPRFGFERAPELGFEPPYAGIPDGAFMARRLRSWDAAIAGRIVYPPAFDDVAHGD